MLKINDLKLIDNEILQEFELSLNTIKNLFDGEYKFTSELCFIYMNNSDFIKDSILDLVERENFYSVNILYRSLIEHFLRFNYFFFNFGLEGKNDEYSKKFRTALVFADKLSIMKSRNSADKIKKVIEKTEKQIQQEVYGSSDNFQKYNLEELLSFSKKISIKNIINFTENHIGKNNPVPNDFLIDILIRYSKQSSYVHGGIFAHQEFSNFASKGEENRLINLTVIYGLSLQTATFIKIYSYLILSKIEPKLLDYYFKITTSIMKMTPNYNCR